MFTLNCKGKIVSLQKPVVMGIINITPDSFYEGHLNKATDEIVAMAGKMIEAGAEILDVGGQSTRPGSNRITATEESERVIPVIQLLHAHFPETILSIDSYHSMVAEEAVKAGASIVNDISSGEMDDRMIPLVASLKVPYICMHMKGTPEHMHQNIHYDDVVKEVLDFFIQKLAAFRESGIHDLIVDPGFGFGKTITHNMQLLKNLALFQMLDKPILTGLSRKSTVYKTLGITAAEALNGTTVLNTLAMLNGASILRVHDVREAKEAIKLVETYQQA